MTNAAITPESMLRSMVRFAGEGYGPAILAPDLAAPLLAGGLIRKLDESEMKKLLADVSGNCMGVAVSCEAAYLPTEAGRQSVAKTSP